ncbi:MAG: hypothetical protein NVS3B25_07200 [Hymenobacter sp.]
MNPFPPHTPPQVHLPVAYSCPACQGAEVLRDELDGLSHCPECSNGLVTSLVPLHLVLALHPKLTADQFHAAVVGMAQDCRAKAPALTHNTSALPVGQLPTRKRIPLQPRKQPA